MPANGCSRRGLQHVERAGGKVNAQDGQQHEDRTRQRVQEEFDGRVLRPILCLAPNADQEVHRHQADLPEHVEQHQVERNKHPKHAHFQEQKQEEKFPHPHLDDARGVIQPQRGQECGQEDQRHAQPIHAHVVIDVEHRDPGHVHLELHPADGFVVAKPKHDRQSQRQEADGKGAGLDQPFLVSLIQLEPFAPRQQHEQRADERDESNDGKKRVGHEESSMDYFGNNKNAPSSTDTVTNATSR